MQFNQSPLEGPTLEELLNLSPEEARANLAAKKIQEVAETEAETNQSATNTNKENQLSPEKSLAVEAAYNFQNALNTHGLNTIENYLISLSSNSQSEIEKALKVFGFNSQTISQLSRLSLKANYREILKIVHPDQYSFDPTLFESYNNILREINRIYAQLSTQINN